MLCIENIADKQTKEMLPAEVAIGNRIAQAAQKRGLLVRPVGHYNILSPPLILTRDQIDWLVGVLRESITEVADGLKAGGYLAS